MTQRIDDNLLLAFIEDELSPNEAARVRAMLADDPEFARRVEAMRQDRALLMAVANQPEPALPADFLQRVESQLTRPMLIESDEGRASNGEAIPVVVGTRGAAMTPARVAARFALAAAILLALFAGTWTMMSLPRAGLTEEYAILDRAEPPAPVDQPTQGRTMAEIDARSSVQLGVVSPAGAAEASDHAPTTGAPGGKYGLVGAGGMSAPEDDLHLADAMVSAPAAGDGLQERRRGVASPGRQEIIAGRPFPLELMLLVRSDEPLPAERALEAIVNELAPGSSLVTNFDYAFARELERNWLASAVESREPIANEPLIHPAPADDLEILAERAKQQFALEHAHEDPSLAAMSRQIAGARQFSPSVAQQLTFSRGGATHTLSLTVADVEPTLVRLAVREGLETRFMPLSAEIGDGAETARAPDEAAWSDALPRLRELTAQLETLDPHSMIHLPLRIE